MNYQKRLLPVLPVKLYLPFLFFTGKAGRREGYSVSVKNILPVNKSKKGEPLSRSPLPFADR